MSEAPGQPSAAEARRLRVLFLENNADDVELLVRELEKAGWRLQTDVAEVVEEFERRVRDKVYDVILADSRLLAPADLDRLRLVQKAGRDTSLILVADMPGEETAIEGLRRGAADYVLKHQLARLPVAVRRALEEKALREKTLRAVEALGKSEKSFRFLFTNNPMPMWVFDRKTLRFLEVNAAAVAHYGYSRDDFLAMKITDIRPREDIPSLLEHMEREAGGLHHAGTWRHRNKNGRLLDVQVVVHELDFGGRPARLVVAQDVTEQRRADAALRESEARYRSLFENAAYGVYRARPDGEILDANSALVKMLAYESKEEFLAQRQTRQFFRNPSEGVRWTERCRKASPADGEFEWLRKDGRPITVRLSGRRALDQRQGEDCLEVIVEDITEKRGLEKQLQQVQKFEAIGQLAGGIAHDFNNMIGAILGWADLGLEEAPPESPWRRSLQKIRDQATRAAGLTRQLLAFARRQILEPRNLDLNQLVFETLGLLEKVIGSDIELKTNLAKGLALVRADPSQVEQVLMNLCLNARDAMPKGGHLVIETTNVNLGEDYCRRRTYARPGRYVLVAVSDTGIGMDAATLEHIFEPFFTTKEVGKGTGLGLSTVYGIVKQHGGFVNVYSEPGHGSTFRIYFPVSPSAEPSSVKAEETTKVLGGSETILVAEDHDGMRELALETLAGLGYHVVLAADGEAAVREFRAARGRISLALLDVVLPKLSGPDVYAQISAEWPNALVIFATGYSAEAAMPNRADIRDVPILQKPYTPHELARKVREVLDRNARKLPVGKSS